MRVLQDVRQSDHTGLVENANRIRFAILRKREGFPEVKETEKGRFHLNAPRS